MILGIDGTNISSGGGMVHLTSFLNNALPLESGITNVIIWAPINTLNKIDNKDWLIKVSDPVFESGLLKRFFWQLFTLNKELKKNNCDIVFIPSGYFLVKSVPVVLILQNLILFNTKEIFRFINSPTRFIKTILLRILQGFSINNSDGVIHLTNSGKDIVNQIYRNYSVLNAVIPHGINRSFLNDPKVQRSIREVSNDKEFKVLYISIIEVYKHHSRVVEAVSKLRSLGIPITLNLVGGVGTGSKQLNSTIKKLDPKGSFVTYSGFIPNNELRDVYQSADIGVFASSCEALPIILLEYMASGLPIACSNSSTMMETLGDGGLYFNPEDSEDIANCILKLINSVDLRSNLAQIAYHRANQYSWEKCSSDILKFIAKVKISADSN